MARVSWPSLASLNPQACRNMWEREFCSHARPGNHALRRAAFRDEDVWGRWGLSQELAQRANATRRAGSLALKIAGKYQVSCSYSTGRLNRDG
jgi:hypothetical protein